MKNDMPPSIVKAVCVIKATLAAVKKSQNNKHGGYMYASTDDIYAAITHKMGEVGLLCLGLEDGAPEIERFPNKEGVPMPWMKVAYCFILATETDTWTDPRARRSIFLQITGPQTFQTAQSYCEKSFLRSLFKIPTGDMDLDSLPEGYEYNPVTFKPKAVPPAPPPVAETVVEETKNPIAFDVPDFLRVLDDLLSVAQDSEALGETWAYHETTMEDHLTRADREAALDIYQRHEKRISRGDAINAKAMAR